MTLLDTALYWHSQGISVVPTFYRSKKPMIKWAWLKESLPTAEQISKWFEDDRRYNLALLTTDRFVILDFDDPQQYAEWFAWQSEHNPSVLDTYIVSTSRGLHLYYRLEQPLTEPVKGKNLPYEVKSHGRLITIPPSVHPTGIPYRAITDPDKILTVSDINQVLTFSPIKIKRTVIKNSDPWQIKQNGSSPIERVDLLALFPDARQTDDEGRYFITHCPFHGHRWNFWLDIEWNICGCYGGCTPPNGDSFLATELLEVLNGTPNNQTT